LYSPKWTIDLFGEFYKGYYLAPKHFYIPENNNYYKRPDIRISMIGIAAFRNLNEKKFSFRASLVQTEWQKKSAGSVLLGGEIFYGVTRGDSALVPVNIADQYHQSGISAVRFIVLGPGAGYAYTQVVLKNFFITGSVVASADVSYATESGYLIKANHFSFAPNVSYRFAIGYNSAKWTINATLVGNRVRVKAASSDAYIFSTGNCRLTYAYRFTPGPKLKKILSPIDHLNKEKSIEGNH
jgi:hypothetical protein